VRFRAEFDDRRCGLRPALGRGICLLFAHRSFVPSKDTEALAGKHLYTQAGLSATQIAQHDSGWQVRYRHPKIFRMREMDEDIGKTSATRLSASFYRSSRSVTMGFVMVTGIAYVWQGYHEHK
jgi:hypothetical protein